MDALQLRWGEGEEDDNGFCTCTHVGCYATDLRWEMTKRGDVYYASSFGAGEGGEDIRCSTCWMLGKWFGVVEGVGNVSCVGRHVGCDATGVCVWTGMITFLALVHMLDATRLVWGVG